MTITLTTALRYEAEFADVDGFDKREFEFFQNNDNAVVSSIITVPSAVEADLDTSGVPTQGCVYIENIGSNFITYGPKSGGVMIPLAQLYPTEYVFLRLDPTSTLRWQADTADVRVLVWIFEE